MYSFTVSGVSLNRGVNQLTAMARDRAFNRAYHQVNVNVFDPIMRRYLYDENGNMRKKNAWQYTYDYENRLIEVRKGSDVVAQYAYDYLGRRISATEEGVTAHYLYDGFDVILERSSAGQTLTRYTRNHRAIGGIGGIMYRESGNEVLYFLYDGVGNVVALANEQGAIVQRYTYSAFGEMISQSGSVENPYQFQTKHLSSSTNLVNFGFRNYSPLIGRFTTPDPMGFVDGPNVYGYVGNNPLNLIDPFGLCEEGKGEKTDFPEIPVPPLIGAIAISQLDSPAPGPADIIALYIVYKIADSILQARSKFGKPGSYENPIPFKIPPKAGRNYDPLKNPKPRKGTEKIYFLIEIARAIIKLFGHR